MLIVDVMRRLNTEHEVAFLLTAYIETLPFYDAAKHLPRGVTELPLKDADDIESRFNELLVFAHSHCGTQNAMAREATEIFSVAFTRLQTLRPSNNRPVAQHASAQRFAETTRSHISN